MKLEALSKQPIANVSGDADSRVLQGIDTAIQKVERQVRKKCTFRASDEKELDVDACRLAGYAVLTKGGTMGAWRTVMKNRLLLALLSGGTLLYMSESSAKN